MSLLKRVLLFFAELSIPIFGVALALALVYRFGSEESDLLVVGFFGILVVSVIRFILFRRKSRAWKIKLDAASFLRWRALQKPHPRQARINRLARTLLWLPSLLAALTCFFLSARSHTTFPGRYLAPHYRFVVPWNWMIIKGPGAYPFISVYFSNVGAARYGITPF
jgi:hypothetical protein